MNTDTGRLALAIDSITSSKLESIKFSVASAPVHGTNEIYYYSFKVHISVALFKICYKCDDLLSMTHHDICSHVHWIRKNFRFVIFSLIHLNFKNPIIITSFSLGNVFVRFTVHYK